MSYLFSRTARLAAGNPEKQIAWAVKITEKVNQITENPVSLWTNVFSPAQGTLVWTAIVEDLVTLETADNKLIADAGYLGLVEEASGWDSGQAVDDRLLELIHFDENAGDRASQYASTVRATLAPGSMAKGIQLGVEAAQLVSKITGVPTAFGVASTGEYGAVAWITTYTSVQELQSAQQALNADASFVELVDQKLSSVYLPGHSTQSIVRKIV
jgi:hypothetical protein